MDIYDMTLKEIKALDVRDWQEDIGIFYSLVLLPATNKKDMHESGYRLMDFIAVKDGKAICRLSGCSDVLHINGISGTGELKGSFPNMIKPVQWSIDCLPVSGLLQLWSPGNNLKAGLALSSFEIFAVPTKG